MPQRDARWSPSSIPAPAQGILVLRVVAVLPRPLSGCFLSGRWNQRLQEQCVCWRHLENGKGQGRLSQLMATLCPLIIRLFQVLAG